MIISVVVLMVATTYHCSAQPSIRFRQGAAWIFWAQEPDVDAEKNRAMMVKTISRDELKQKIDPKDNFPLVETLTAVTYHHQYWPEGH
jgi:hypothetical protein